MLSFEHSISPYSVESWNITHGFCLAFVYFCLNFYLIYTNITVLLSWKSINSIIKEKNTKLIGCHERLFISFGVEFAWIQLQLYHICILVTKHRKLLKCKLWLKYLLFIEIKESEKWLIEQASEKTFSKKNLLLMFIQCDILSHASLFA